MLQIQILLLSKTDENTKICDTEIVATEENSFGGKGDFNFSIL